MGLIPTTYFNGVVALCYENKKGEVKGLASGFLFGYNLSYFFHNIHQKHQRL